MRIRPPRPSIKGLPFQLSSHFTLLLDQLVIDVEIGIVNKYFFIILILFWWHNNIIWNKRHHHLLIMGFFARKTKGFIKTKSLGGVLSLRRWVGGRRNGWMSGSKKLIRAAVPCYQLWRDGTSMASPRAERCVEHSRCMDSDENWLYYENKLVLSSVFLSFATSVPHISR